MNIFNSNGYYLSEALSIDLSDGNKTFSQISIFSFKKAMKAITKKLDKRAKIDIFQKFIMCIYYSNIIMFLDVTLAN